MIGHWGVGKLWVGAMAATWLVAVVAADLFGWRLTFGAQDTAPIEARLPPPPQPQVSVASPPKADPPRVEQVRPTEIDTYAGRRPSWCDKALKWAEKHVCGDSFLASLDARLEDAYLAGRSALSGRQRSDFDAAQLEWIKTWWQTCGLGPAGAAVPGDVTALRRCLVEFYIMRIRTLAGKEPPPSVLASAMNAAPPARPPGQRRPPPIKQQIAQALMAQSQGFSKCVAGNGGLQQVVRQHPDGLLRLEFVDLDGDGASGIIAIGEPPCYLGARRPAHWVLRWRGEELLVILHAGVAEGVTVAPQGTKNGLRNLVSTSINGIGTSVWRTVFEFDGREYRIAACFEAECENGLKNCRQERRMNCG